MRLSEFTLTEAGIISKAINAIASATGLDEVTSNQLLKKEIRRVVGEWNDYYGGLPSQLRQNLTMQDIQKFFNDVGYGRSGPQVIQQQVRTTNTTPTPETTFSKGDIVSYKTASGVEKQATIVDVSGDEDNQFFRMKGEDGTFGVKSTQIDQYELVKKGETVTEKTEPSDQTVSNVVKNMKKIIPLAVTKAIEEKPELWTQIAQYHNTGGSSSVSTSQSGQSSNMSNREKAQLLPIAQKLQRVDNRELSSIGLNDEQATFLKQFLANQAR